jgi:hypothetical protein
MRSPPVDDLHPPRTDFDRFDFENTRLPNLRQYSSSYGISDTQAALCRINRRSTTWGVAMRHLLLALLLMCGAAQAAEWVSIGKADDRMQETFVDVSTIRTVSGIRRASTKVILVPDTKRGDGDDANKWVDYLLYRLAFNCAETISRMEALTIYYDDGTNRSEPPERLPAWAPVPPSTVEENAMQFICAWGMKSPRRPAGKRVN